MILEFSVDDNILKKNNTTGILDQNTDYYKCKFFPKKEIWKDSIMSVVFMNDIGHIETVELGKYDELLACIVPPDIISEGYFKFYISDGNKKTNTVSIALTNHYNEPEKKCNIIAELFSQIDKKIDNIVYENFQLKYYSNGILKDVVYLGNIDEDLVHYLVKEQLDTFQNTLAPIAFSGSYNDLIDLDNVIVDVKMSNDGSQIIFLTEKDLEV